VGNVRSGLIAAILTSLTSSYRRHVADPQLYLTRFLVNLPAARNNDLPARLPDPWKAAQRTRPLAPKQGIVAHIKGALMQTDGLLYALALSGRPS